MDSLNEDVVACSIAGQLDTIDCTASAVRDEMMRWKAMKKLRNTLVKLCRQADNKTPPISTLERWQCRVKLQEAAATVEPLLPTCPDADPGLQHDLLRTGMSGDQAREIAQKMAAQSIRLADEISGEQHEESDGEPDVQQRGEFFHVAPGIDAKPFFKISARHYEKLRALFRRQRHPELAGIGDLQAYGQFWYDAIDDEPGWEDRAAVAWEDLIQASLSPPPPPLTWN